VTQIITFKILNTSSCKIISITFHSVLSVAQLLGFPLQTLRMTIYSFLHHLNSLYLDGIKLGNLISIGRVASL